MTTASPQYPCLLHLYWPGVLASPLLSVMQQQRGQPKENPGICLQPESCYQHFFSPLPYTRFFTLYKSKVSFFPLHSMCWIHSFFWHSKADAMRFDFSIDLTLIILSLNHSYFGEVDGPLSVFKETFIPHLWNAWCFFHTDLNRWTLKLYQLFIWASNTPAYLGSY